MKKITLTLFWCKVCEIDLIVMLLYVWRCLLDVYTKFQIDISKHLQKRLENFLLAESSINSRQGANNGSTMTKIRRGQDTNYISVCIRSEAFIQFLGHECRERTLNFFGCEVDESDPMGMERELDL